MTHRQEFFSGRYMLLISDASPSFPGWLCWRHPEGQWVTLREATHADRVAITGGCAVRA